MITLQVLVQGIFLFVVTTLLLSWIIPKTCRLLLNAFKIVIPEKPETDDLELYKYQQKECREKHQQQYDSRAAEYKERILIPRIEEKQRKKEEEFLKFLGPAWKGKVSQLGGKNSEDESNGLADAQKAAKRRIVQEDINQEILSAAVSNAAQRQKIKRVITLPDEPNADEPDVVSILFRTPLGTTIHRRFHSTDNVQCLLDLITTKGFSYKTHVISTSYPRLLLNDLDVHLSELNFGKRVVLNIEEKD